METVKYILIITCINIVDVKFYMYQIHPNIFSNSCIILNILNMAPDLEKHSLRRQAFTQVS